MGDLQMTKELCLKLQDRTLPYAERKRLAREIDATDERGDTALHRAAKAGSLSLTVVLLGNGANYQKVNGDGMTPRQAVPNKCRQVKIFYGTVMSLLARIERMKDEKPYLVEDLAEKWIQSHPLQTLKSMLFSTNNRGQTLLQSAVLMGNAAGVELVVNLVLTGHRALIAVNTVPPPANELLPHLNAAIRNLLACERELRDDPQVTTTDEVRERWMIDVIERTVDAALHLIGLFSTNAWLEIVERSCNALRRNCQADEDELEVEHAAIGRWKGTAGETHRSIANKLVRIVRASVIGPCAFAVAYVLSGAQLHAVLNKDEATLRLCLPDDDYLKPLINLNVVDRAGHTSLFYAARDENTTFIDLLLGVPGGIDFKAVATEDQSMIIVTLIKRDNKTRLAEIFDQAPEALEHRNKRGRTPTLMAAACGQLDCLKMLLERGANLWSLTSQMQNVLHLAAAGGHQNIVAHVIERLKGRQGRLRQVLDAQESTFNWTPLHVGCIYDRVNVVRTLLANGANVNMVDRHSRSPGSLVVADSDIATSDIFGTARYLYDMVHSNRDEEVMRLLEAMPPEDRDVMCRARRSAKRNLVNEALFLGKKTLFGRLKKLLKTSRA